MIRADIDNDRAHDPDMALEIDIHASTEPVRGNNVESLPGRLQPGCMNLHGTLCCMPAVYAHRRAADRPERLPDCTVTTVSHTRVE